MRDQPFDQLVQAVQRIAQATDLADIQSAVRNVARPLGYDRFVLFSASAARDEVVERIHWVEGTGSAMARRSTPRPTCATVR